MRNKKRRAELPTTNQKVQPKHHKGYGYIIAQYLPFVNPKGGYFYERTVY